MAPVVFEYMILPVRMPEACANQSSPSSARRPHSRLFGTRDIRTSPLHRSGRRSSLWIRSLHWVLPVIVRIPQAFLQYVRQASELPVPERWVWDAALTHLGGVHFGQSVMKGRLVYLNHAILYSARWAMPEVSHDGR